MSHGMDNDVGLTVLSNIALVQKDLTEIVSQFSQVKQGARTECRAGSAFLTSRANPCRSPTLEHARY